MASPLMKLASLVLAVAICSMLSVDAYACGFCFASSRARNRKVRTRLLWICFPVYLVKETLCFWMQVLSDTLKGIKTLRSSSSTDVEMYSRRWKLREVPRGPDPLHHNGGSPKNKPRTSITPPAWRSLFLNLLGFLETKSKIIYM